MEKTTKKKKKSKGLKKRIGIIAVGGLSLVLTICLSVGATLAWFAGSTWSSNQMYMGGPVYVEMAGLGKAAGTTGSGTGAAQTANWQGGSGNLHIQAATTRTTGTTEYPDSTDMNHILLPGQKFEIYSQARVFSTSVTSDVGTNDTASQTTGGNVANTSSNGTVHKLSKGRITSTTSSVIRARFSINVEFDPTVGFNNFTHEDYAKKYPVQSGLYQGNYIADDEGTTSDTTTSATVAKDGNLNWYDALGKPAFENETATMTGSGATATYKENSRRDAVEVGDYVTDITDVNGNLTKVRNGEKKSIYAWKFVSKTVYDQAADVPESATASGITKSYAKMPKPFNGTVNAQGTSSSTVDGGSGNGYYGVWIIKDGKLSESDAFYKDRCNSYIDSYVEEYVTEYGEIKTRKIGDSLASLENSLNQAFVNLVNDSSDKIGQGNVHGMTAENGIFSYAADPNAGTANAYVSGSTNASWLYIDPKIGNDTNTNELSTSAGGWWYLVEGDGTSVKSNSNKVYVTYDNVSNSVNTPSLTPATSGTSASQFVYTAASGATAESFSGNYFVRNTVNNNATPDNTGDDFTEFGAADARRLYAKLYEINPLLGLSTETLGNGTTTKVVSYSFPFVNGTSALPGDALTNVFANAKITIQISFQALQAFLPYSATIDNMDYTNPLLGTAKALNIYNAIPIFNEAFDYQENVSVNSITGL